MKNIAYMPVMSRPRMTLELRQAADGNTRSGMIGLRSRASSATKAVSSASDSRAEAERVGRAPAVGARR